MSSPSNASLALVNIGGGEIILILVLLFILAVVVLGFLGLIYLIVRAVVNRPPPAPSTLPPEVAIQNQQRRDREHMKLLAIFHFVFAGLAFVGIAFLCVHYAIMHTVFSNPEMWKSQQQAMPPKAFLDAFVWFYLFMGVLLLTGLVLNVLSGFFLLRKRNRLFSLIVGGLNCLQIPFGTALGVFTILILSRDSVRQLYSRGAGNRMKRKPRYQIERPAPGVIAYREGNKEHQFPVFEQDGETVFVEWPTRQRIFLALVTWGWTRVPKEFSKVDRERITPRVVQFLRKEGKPVRVIAPSSDDDAGLEFRPELFECRNLAIEILEAADIVWLSDYSSVDLLHEEYGLEVCGIRQESNVDSIVEAMRAGFPHWHFYGLCHKECGREPGWKFAIHMFPRRCGGGRCVDAE